jgi:uncharacterized protein YndB with AHSA1/START domain
MSKQYIEIQQDFKAPIQEIFSLLTDHEKFGRLLGANIQRITQGVDGFTNGKGSIRRIKSFPVPSFEESVTKFKENEVMEYTVSKGGPIKNHLGTMYFSGDSKESHLTYSIEFEPKIPFTGRLVKAAIEKPLRVGLKKLADSYR